MSVKNELEFNPTNVSQNRANFIDTEINLDSFWTQTRGEEVEIVTEISRPERNRPRVATNVSEIEKVLPWVYDQELRETGVLTEKGSVFGQKLHDLHLICNLLVHDNTGTKLAQGLPTAGEAMIRKMQQITDGLYLNKEMGPEQIEGVLLVAWQRYFEEIPLESGTIPMFAEMGFSNPRAKEAYQQSSDLFAAGIKLIQNWARLAIMENEDEFNSYYSSVAEVMIVINTDRLQLRGRLDTVTRIAKPGQKIQIKLSDLKTGRDRTRTDLEQEIKKRQAQMMLFMAERFAVRFLLGNRWLEQTGKAFVIQATTETWKKNSRCGFSYLRFNQETGDLTREGVEMTDSDRLEFATWLDWYGKQLTEYRQRFARGFQN